MISYLLDKVSSKISMKEAFIKSVSEVFEKYDKTKIILGDIGHFGFQHIWADDKNKERYFNVGILEQTMVGFAAGLSKAGSYPLVHTITPFLVERPFEQIKIDFGLNELKGCFISVGAAFDYSTLGPTHHSYSDLALFSTIPNSHIYSVSSYEELKSALDNSVKNKWLSYIRMNRKIHAFNVQNNCLKNETSIKICEGNNITVVVTGGRLKDTLKAIELLQEKNLNVELIYVYKLKPLQTKIIEDSLNKTNNLLVVEDHSEIGSLYSILLMKLKLRNGFKHSGLNTKDQFIRGYGTYDNLTERAKLDHKTIYKNILSLLNFS
tara:strand:+ start:32011 stop:32976 length:966 start_codon:yes stop_codon:yes gene_type:complete